MMEHDSICKFVTEKIIIVTGSLYAALELEYPCTVTKHGSICICAYYWII